MEAKTQEMLKKVRMVEIRTRRLVNHALSGSYQSAFKGRGIDFEEVREYVYGDDVRSIDWNVTARMNAPYIKKFTEERELTVMLLVDVSASGVFGSVELSKRELAAEVASILAFSAINNNDKVGLLLFTNEVELFIPPKKGREHALFIVRELLTLESAGKRTNIAQAIRFFSQTIRQKSIVFLVSDFLTEGYGDALRVAAARHDLIGIQVYDSLDRQLPVAGLMQVEDMESGETVWLDSSDPLVQFQYTKDFEEKQLLCQEAFRKAAAALLSVSTTDDHAKLLESFFLKR
jgi:uncharacterized protein (DUF58 family)